MKAVETKIPDKMLRDLDMVAEVDGLTRSEAIRMAIRDWFKELDLVWYKEEFEEMQEDEREEPESEESEGDDEEGEEDE